MPTYEYVCEKCGHQFEKIQPISAKPLTNCPEDACAQKRWGKGKVKRAISGGGGLLFKGSGFYITDYRDASYKEKAKADSGEPKKDAAGSDKSEAKAQEKPKVASSTAETAPKSGKSDKKTSSKPATES